MNPMNPFAAAALLTATTSFLLTFLVFLYKKTKFHNIWILFNLSILGWALFVFRASVSNDPTAAYNSWKYAHIIGIYVAVFYFHSICLFCNLQYPVLIRLSYIYAFADDFLQVINNGDFLYQSDNTKYLFHSIYYIQAKNLNFFTSMIPWFFFVLFGIYQLNKFSKRNKGQENYQAKLWMILSILGYIGGCSPFLPMFGINIYPIILFLLPIYSITMTYAVLKYQFFNVRIVLEKSILYSTLAACLSILYLILVVASEKLLQHSLNYQSPKLSLFLTFLIGISVIPLRNKIQIFLDRFLFQGTTIEISKQNVLLRQEVAQTEKHKAVAALASGIAHEVRNPLTALKTFCEHFPEKKNDPEFIAKFQQITGKEIGRIEGLIHQLLDFAKPSPPVLKETDINKLIEDTLDLLANKLQTHNIKVDHHLSPNTCHLKVDPNQIKQALLNILLNAIDAMAEGGQLTIQTTSNEQQATISIQDTGPGIPPEDLKHLFEPFFSKKASGTGLGLAITQGIIEEHQGKIKVTSALNQGTTFTIELPTKP